MRCPSDRLRLPAEDFRRGPCATCGEVSMLVDGYCPHHYLFGPVVDGILKAMPGAVAVTFEGGTTILDLSNLKR